MIWFTWRQFRTPALVTAAVLAAFGVLLLISARDVTGLYAGVAGCTSDCDNAIATPIWAAAECILASAARTSGR